MDGRSDTQTDGQKVMHIHELTVHKNMKKLSFEQSLIISTLHGSERTKAGGAEKCGRASFDIKCPLVGYICKL